MDIILHDDEFGWRRVLLFNEGLVRAVTILGVFRTPKIITADLLRINLDADDSKKQFTWLNVVYMDFEDVILTNKTK